MPAPYYGVVRIDALPPVPGAEDELRWQPAAAWVPVDEPVTPWLFPFDFAGELLSAPWRAREVSAKVAAAPRPELLPSVHPPLAAALRERASTARTAR